MKVAVVGGGFTGLSAAVRLIDLGAEVTLFESTDRLGGLAGGFKDEKWRWTLEDFYHHVFTNDKEIISLAGRVGWPVKIFSPVTTSFIEGKEIQLDSPLSVLMFTKIGFFSRVHMGLGLGVLKVIRNGLFLERYRVVDLLPKLIGKEGYERIWSKLLKAKFGSQYNVVNMAWFWTRVAKRTKKLGYFEGGFQKLANKIGEYVEEKGGRIVMGCGIETLDCHSSTKLAMTSGVKINGEEFDGVIITTPAAIARSIYPAAFAPEIKYLWGQTLVLEMSNSLINGYWMNILENNWPFLVAVEHTNMVDKKFYGNKTIVYLGNYLEEGHEQLKMTKDDLVERYLPYLKKINNRFDKSWISKSFLIRKPFSQPVFPVNYSKVLPEGFTKDGKVYIANMGMVYPFDRGTNYAVKMGNEVAKRVAGDLRLKNA
jgi:protoporphyrinogen oxidase